MVMEIVRATSFIRRSSGAGSLLTHRASVAGVMTRTATAGGLESGLLISGDGRHLEYGGQQQPVYTWRTDIDGLKGILHTKLNLLLILVPAGITAHFWGLGYMAVFWLNFVALVPLAGLLGTITEELALHTGDLMGGLLNATFGNAVEMIITVNALRAGLVDVVQGSLLGSILSNLLLVLGTAFLLGGMFHHVQTFNARGATCSSSLLLLATLAFMAPTVASTENDNFDQILLFSRLTAILMAVTYALFLLFQLGTHFYLFKEDNSHNIQEGGDHANIAAGGAPFTSLESSLSAYAGVAECPAVSLTTALVSLALVTGTVALSSECLVSSIEAVSVNSGLSEAFIGVILLPIVGNAAEHVTAISVAIKDKPDLTMGVAVGSSTQIALFMVPFAVLVAWAMSIPLTLVFSKVAVTVLAFSVLIVLGVVQDGESNWLEGVMLIVAYLIVAMVFLFNSASAHHVAGAAV